jgi:copper transport protein
VRWPARVAVVAALIAAAIVTVPARADAHATLESSEPAQGAALESAPVEIVLRFDEPVDISSQSIKLYDAARQTLSAGRPSRSDGGKTIRVALPTLTSGGYVVTWRVVSADSHPVSGAFTFTVGDPGAAVSAADVVNGTPRNHAVGVTFGVVRAAGYLGLIVLLGAAWFIAACWPQGLRSRPLRFLVWAGWALALAATIASIGFQGAYVSGAGLRDVVRPSRWHDVVDTRYGHYLVFRSALLIVTGALLWVVTHDLVPNSTRARRIRNSTGVALSVLLCASVAFAGHSATGTHTTLGRLAGTLHVLAGSIWLGGVVALVVALRHADHATAVARRFSTVALAAVGTLVATGVIQTWREIPTLQAFTDSSYGRLLTAKLLIVVLVLAAATASRRLVHGRILTPGQRIAPVGDVPSIRAAGLLGAVAVEVLAGVAIVGVTAALVAAAPPHTAVSGPYENRRVVGDTVIDVVIDPTTAGPTELHLYLTPTTGNARRVDEITATLTKPPQVRGPINVDLLRGGPDHFVSNGLFIPFAGAWTLQINARYGEFDVVTSSFDVTFR